MIKPYESGDMVVVDSNQQVWLVCTRLDEQTYLVQGRNGNRIRLHTDKNKSRLARQDERDAGRKIDRPDEAACDHCGFSGLQDELHVNQFDETMPLTCPICHSRTFNGGDWLYKCEEPAKNCDSGAFNKKHGAMYRKAKKTAVNANGEVL